MSPPTSVYCPPNLFWGVQGRPRRAAYSTSAQASEHTNFLVLAAYGVQHYSSVLELLLSVGVSVCNAKDKCTPLHVVAQRCETVTPASQQVVGKLVAAGVDINALDNKGKPALLYANTEV